jgi:archaellum biogenesis ATPase FlaH
LQFNIPKFFFTMKKPINEIISTSLFLDEEINQPPPILTIDNKTIATEGNFITISGQPKSRKTTFAFFMIASGLLQKPIFNIKLNLLADEKIILIDTEQSIFDFARQIKILKFTLKCKKLPTNFSAYLFRQYEPEQIIEAITIIMERDRPKILILDNLTELVINPNDIPESKKIIQFLKRITAQYNCCIITLLHNSKSTNNTLGNLGSYADRGAQSTLRATIDKETDIFTLEPVFMRSDAYFKPINVFYNKENNQYEQTETAPKKESKKFNVNNFDEADHINRIGAIFRTQKEISYNELVEEIKQIYGIGTNGAKQKIIPYLTGNNFLKSNKGIYTRTTSK